MTDTGDILYYEADEKSDDPIFRPAFRASLATGQGRCVTFSEDGATVFAGTKSEIIQFDIATGTAERIQEVHCVGIWVYNNTMLYLTPGGFYRQSISKIKVPIESIKFKHQKISLIGHTGSGKSTLCNQLIAGTPGSEQSTFGKKIWTWNLDLDCSTNHRIILHDHGGQQAVMSTFIPFLFDSELILIFFKQTDKTTLDRALTTLEDIEESITISKKIIFVETFIDNEMDESRAKSKMDDLIKSGRIVDYVKACPLYGTNINVLKNRILQLIDWDNAGLIIRLESADRIRQILESLADERIPKITLDELVDRYNSEYSTSIPKEHARFLISNLSTEGGIEYYPEQSDMIIINDEAFNNLRSEIPILASASNGVLSMTELKRKYPKLGEYLDILDEIYTRYGFCIRHNDLRLFPDYFPENLTFPTKLKEEIKNNRIDEEWSIRVKKNAHFHLTQTLVETIPFISASKWSGVYSWNGKAAIYYIMTIIPNTLDEDKLVIKWTIGGKDKGSCTLLAVRFERILETLFGEPIDAPIYRLIREGENKFCEFKASLRYDYETKTPNPVLEFKVADAIAAFMNTDKGGNLLIGVNNEGHVLGIQRDLKTLARNKQNSDGFNLRLTDIVRKFIGEMYLDFFNVQFKFVRGKLICHVKVQKATKPAFVKIPDSLKELRKTQKTLFGHRTSSGTQHLDTDKASEYINDKW